MIVTLTANPAIDRLVPLRQPWERGAVLRGDLTQDQPGGKGINVARVVHAAGERSCAVFPAAGDALVDALSPTGLAIAPVPISGATRINMTIAEPDGTTTKVNAAGAALDPEALERMATTLTEVATQAAWVALCGSLPPGTDPAWYAQLITRLRPAGMHIAVDTSGTALAAVLQEPGAAPDQITPDLISPDLITPNAQELVEAVGGSPAEVAAIESDPSRASYVAQRLRRERGPRQVLLTLGATGAVLATERGSWFCAPPPITPRSTVGAGDAALAGYLVARVRGADDALCLASAVAHGSAATALPGSTPPTAADVAALPAVVAERLDDRTPHQSRRIRPTEGFS